MESLGYQSRIVPRVPIKPREIIRSIGVYALLVVVTLIFAAPFYWLFVTSLSTQDQIFSIPPRLAPIPPVITNFRDVFLATPLLRAFINSTVIAVAHVSLALLLCCWPAMRLRSSLMRRGTAGCSRLCWRR